MLPVGWVTYICGATPPCAAYLEKFDSTLMVLAALPVGPNVLITAGP